MTHTHTHSKSKMHPTSKRPKPKDDRNKVTHYAFMVAPRLLGEPIARPWRRGLAQCVDLALIGVLSQLPSVLLAALTAMAFLRAGRKKNSNIQSSAAKKWMRGAGVVLLFLVALIVADSLKPNNTKTENEQNFSRALVFGAHLVSWQKCGEDIECLGVIANQLGEDFAKTELGRADSDTLLTDYMAKINLSEEQRQQIRTRFLDSFDSALVDSKLPEATESNSINSTEHPSDSNSASWPKDLADQFSLGIGWATLYHSVFIAWFRGRTPGKKIFKIRVVKLDGTAFSLWDSFCRYGGYCAGLATGFLGFVQIYWDANRQAIQDKIAETVVIFEP